MNINKIYSEATGRVELSHKRIPQVSPDGIISQEQPDAARAQLKVNWLQSSITQELLESLGSKVSALIDEAIVTAVTYPQHQNHHKIIQLLVKAHTVKEIIRENKNV